MRSLLVLFTFFFANHIALGQLRCAVDLKNRATETEIFESWLRKQNRANAPKASQDQVITIPVVVHVVHNGELLGEGSNISRERILQQIDILNADFSRTNADASLTPAEFLGVAANVGIQFELARQDPNGLVTDGITRTQGTQTVYRFQEDPVLKSTIHWPSEDYMNLYIANLQGFLGWAEFPFSPIEGIPDINIESELDGVVLDHRFVGLNSNTGTFRSFGRTGTHEVGHYLGLRHVWGDGGCNADDFCTDTPLSSVSYAGGCPSEDQSSCGSNDMYSNFLNFTDDACMNIFTECQKQRMRTVLFTSPRRASLINSPALTDPTTFAMDLGIQEVVVPPVASCTQVVTPAMIVTNFGTTEITNFNIQLFNEQETIGAKFIAANLEPLDTVMATFDPITLQDEQTLRFMITAVNGVQDDNDANNLVTVQAIGPRTERIPYSEHFESASNFNTISDNPALITVEDAPNTTLGNQAARFNFYQEPNELGEKQILLLPHIDTNSITSANLQFEYAYGNDSTTSLDGLILAVSRDCGVTFPESGYLFRQFGSGLKTTARNLQGPYTPSGPGEWTTATINITSLLSEENLRFALIGINGSGNHIYVDNFRIDPADLKAVDISLSPNDRVPLTTCESFIRPTINVSNEGFETINSFDLQYNLNGSSEVMAVETSLEPGEDQDITFRISNLTDGTNTIELSLINPNGQPDGNTEDNSETFILTVDNTEQGIPIRQQFGSLAPWVVTSSDGQSDFSLEENAQWIKARGFQNSLIGKESWLVSPVLSTESFQSGSLLFDIAYTTASVGSEQLRVLLSVTCGETFETTLLNLVGSDLVTAPSVDDFVPNSSNDWRRELIDISRFMLFPDIRLAFVFTNGGGNNLYLDNIEIAPTAANQLREFEEPLVVYPNPSMDGNFSVTLNLPQKEEATLSVVDMQGKIQARFKEEGALNQTYNFSNLTKGLYLLQVHTATQNYGKRIIVRD